MFSQENLNWESPYLVVTNTHFAIRDGHTALRTASFNGHHKVVELLLGAGANPDLLVKVTTQQDNGVHSNLSSVHLVKPGVLNNLLFTCLYAYYPDSVYLTNTGTCPLVCTHNHTPIRCTQMCIFTVVLRMRIRIARDCKLYSTVCVLYFCHVAAAFSLSEFQTFLEARGLKTTIYKAASLKVVLRLTWN